MALTERRLAEVSASYMRGRSLRRTAIPVRKAALQALCAAADAAIAGDVLDLPVIDASRAAQYRAALESADARFAQFPDEAMAELLRELGAERARG
jgi:hypothetical protein